MLDEKELLSLGTRTDRLEPFGSSLRWRHASPSSVLPQVAGNFFKLGWTYSAPPLLKPVSASGNPNLGWQRFHMEMLVKYCIYVQLSAGGSASLSHSARASIQFEKV